MGLLDRFRRPQRPAPPTATAPPVAFTRLRALAVAGASVEEQRAALDDGFRAHGLSPAAIELVTPRIADAIALVESDDAAGNTRIGGAPLLPKGSEWPRDRDGQPLDFIAAIDLAEQPALEPLPGSGTLLVFWSEHWIDWERPDVRVATRVYLTDAAEAVPDAPSSREVRLTGVLTPLLGGHDDLDGLSDSDEEALYNAYDELSQIWVHQLLGISRDVQGPALDEISYWFDRAFDETRADYSDAELAGEGWMLLAQIEEAGDLVFGDAGALYLVIPRADLVDRRFDRVLGIMQCH